MQLTLSDEQRILAGTAAAFAKDSAGASRLRALRDAGDKLAYSRTTYAQMAELGFTSIAFSESDGGLGLGLSSLVVVTEALGRTLTPEPLVPSMLAADVLAIAGNDAQKQELLAPALAGGKVLALAHSERGARYDLACVETRAEKKGTGYVLSGEKLHVWGGYGADGLIVSARVAGGARDAIGIGLFYVPADARGVTLVAESRVDSQNAAIVRLQAVEVAAAAVIGVVGQAHAVLTRAVDRATVALTGEMLGGMSEAFERTVAYLKERKQFGVAIGSFQALKHRAARMYVEIELARSSVMAAARALDEDAPDAALLVSLAKARLSDAYCQVANEAVQMHAGIGMTDEHDIGFFMKRARACEFTFGDAAFHRERYATLSGY